MARTPMAVLHIRRSGDIFTTSLRSGHTVRRSNIFWISMTSRTLSRALLDHPDTRVEKALAAPAAALVPGPVPAAAGAELVPVPAAAAPAAAAPTTAVAPPAAAAAGRVAGGTGA